MKSILLVAMAGISTLVVSQAKGDFACQAYCVSLRATTANGEFVIEGSRIVQGVDSRNSYNAWAAMRSQCPNSGSDPYFHNSLFYSFGRRQGFNGNYLLENHVVSTVMNSCTGM